MAVPTEKKPMKIILVFKTHFDIGFTDLAETVLQGYGDKMLRQVIATCRATENMGKLRYVWTMPAWPLWYICRNCVPELKPKLDRLIEAGQIVWHGLPFTSHTDFSAPEEYAEAFRYSRELARQYGKEMPIAAKMTDVPGHGLMLPELLSQAGIRFLHLGCNEFSMPPEVPPLFFWQGPGGGQVLTMYSPGGYGTKLLPPEDWPYPVWMALMHTNDNQGPQSADKILDIVGQIREVYPDAEILCGTMDDFCRELEKCDLSRVPVIRRDLADTWIHGVGSYPAEVSLMRQCRERSRQLHSMYYRYLLSGNAEIPELEPLWRQYYDSVALFTEHTWGADVKTFLGPARVYEKAAFLKAKATAPYRFMERSWQEQRLRAAQARDYLEKIEALLGYVPEKAGKPGSPVDAALTDGLLTVWNRYYRLVLDTRTGQILELIDARTGVLLLTAGAFSYRYDRYGIADITEFLRGYGYRFSTWGIQDFGRENYPECGHETYAPEFTGWQLSERTLSLSYRTAHSSAAYGDSEVLRLTVTFPEESRELRVSLVLENKQETPFVESGSLLFPFAGKAAYSIGKPGGVVNPERDIQPRCNHALFNLERQVTVYTEQGSVSVCSPDAPLFGIGTPGVYEYPGEFGENRDSRIYFNLFNTMWGTNFPQWIGGRLKYRFAIASNVPDPQAWAAGLCRGSTPAVPEGMELLEARVEDGILFVLLRDLTGEARECCLHVENAQLCHADILRSLTGPWTENEIHFQTRPYGLQTVAVRKHKL